MNGKSKVVVIGLVGLVVLVGVITGLAVFGASGRALEGEHVHDFGTVTIEGDGSAFEHTFSLTNTSGRPVHLKSIRPSCSCTVASLSAHDIGPGESLVIDATLSLDMSGEQETFIELLTDEGIAAVLKMRAIGRRDNPLIARDGRAGIPREGSGHVAIQLEVHDSDDEPAVPNLQAPPGVVATFAGWRNQRQRKSEAGMPALWRGRIELRRTGTPIADDATLIITAPQVSAQAIAEIPLDVVDVRSSP